MHVIDRASGLGLFGVRFSFTEDVTSVQASGKRKAGNKGCRQLRV